MLKGKKNVKLSPQEVVDAHRFLSGINITYIKKVNLSIYQDVEEGICVSCEIRISSTYKKVKLSP
jgi:hypothetical protein